MKDKLPPRSSIFDDPPMLKSMADKKSIADLEGLPFAKLEKPSSFGTTQIKEPVSRSVDQPAEFKKSSTLEDELMIPKRPAPSLDESPDYSAPKNSPILKMQLVDVKSRRNSLGDIIDEILDISKRDSWSLPEGVSTIMLVDSLSEIPLPPKCEVLKLVESATPSKKLSRIIRYVGDFKIAAAFWVGHLKALFPHIKIICKFKHGSDFLETYI